MSFQISTNHILPFLTDLAANNNREWFAENKTAYEQARVEFTDLVAVLIERISEFDPQIRYLEAKECLFRIYRDTRFSSDKTPYKNHFGAYIARNGGRRSEYSGYYVHLEPGNCMLSGGIWCYSNEGIKHFRSVLDTEYEELQEIVRNPDFIRYFGGRLTSFETLKRPPMGYRADHPAIEWLKMKQWFAEHHFSDTLVTSPDFIQHLLDAANVLKPYSYWCNRAMFEV